VSTDSTPSVILPGIEFALSSHPLHLLGNIPWHYTKEVDQTLLALVSLCVLPHCDACYDLWRDFSYLSPPKSSEYLVHRRFMRISIFRLCIYLSLGTLLIIREPCIWLGILHCLLFPIFLGVNRCFTEPYHFIDYWVYPNMGHRRKLQFCYITLFIS